MKKLMFMLIGCFIAVSGVIAYKYMPGPWYMLMWIPINVGYSMF